MSAQADPASSKIQAANTALDQAFSAVLDAEKAGANITGLMDQLNTAGNALAQAENSYRAGNLDAAASQADSVISITQGVMESAHNIQQTAVVSTQNAFWLTIALSTIGALVFVLALFLVWRLFKRRYVNGLSQTKPEVPTQ